MRATGLTATKAASPSRRKRSAITQPTKPTVSRRAKTSSVQAHDALHPRIDAAGLSVPEKLEQGGMAKIGPTTHVLCALPPLLLLYADLLDDLEKTRVANGNRHSALTRDSDIPGGKGMPAEHEDVAFIGQVVERIEAIERDITKRLEKQMAKHRLAPFIRRTKGLGLKGVARFLGQTGDLRWNSLHERPRTLGELFAYCGLHVVHGSFYQGSNGNGKNGGGGAHPGADHHQSGGVAPRRVRGQKSNWSTKAKTMAYRMADPCVKGKGPYRKVYEDARAKYENAKHVVECAQCGKGEKKGVAGKPAAVGTDLRDGHKHGRAMRAVMKKIIEDLWIESGGHDSAPTQR